MRWWNAIFEI